MALKKIGTSQKISEVTASDAEFEKMKSKIALDNNLKRCGSCGQLLAKFDAENQTMNLQRKSLDVIAKVTDLQVKCPKCKHITSI